MAHADSQAYGVLYLSFGPPHRPPKPDIERIFAPGPISLYVDKTVEVLNIAADLPRILDVLAGGKDVLWLEGDHGADLSREGRELMLTVCDAGFEVCPLTPPDLPGLIGAARVHLFRNIPRKEHRAAFRELRHDRHPLLLMLPASALASSLEITIKTLGDRKALLWYSPTNRIYHQRLSRLADLILPRGNGEARLLIRGLTPDDRDQVVEMIADCTAENLAPSEIARRLAARLDIPKSEAYDLVMNLAEAQTAEPAVVGSDEVIRFTARGHERLRGTHHKTLELKRGDDLSERETCVIAVGADWSADSLKRCRGRVSVELAVNGLSDSFSATICPQFNARDRIVFRKSGKQSRVTLGVHAGKGAADVNRDLVKALTDPDARLTVTIRGLEEDG